MKLSWLSFARWWQLRDLVCLACILAERFPWSFGMGKHHGRSIVQEAYTAYGYELWSLLKKNESVDYTFWSTESESNPDPSFRDDTRLSCHHFPSPPQRKRYVPDMREEEMDGGVHQKILEISQLPSTAAVAGDYGNVRYLAQQLLSPWRDRDFKQDGMPWTCYRCNKHMHVFIQNRLFSHCFLMAVTQYHHGAWRW